MGAIGTYMAPRGSASKRFGLSRPRRFLENLEGRDGAADHGVIAASSVGAAGTDSAAPPAVFLIPAVRLLLSNAFWMNGWPFGKGHAKKAGFIGKWLFRSGPLTTITYQP